MLIPLQAFPAVCAWIVASYNTKPSGELLDAMLLNTPAVLVGLFWDLIHLPSTDIKRRRW